MENIHVKKSQKTTPERVEQAHIKIDNDIWKLSRYY
jgi:hypothetical protein